MPFPNVPSTYISAGTSLIRLVSGDDRQGCDREYTKNYDTAMKFSKPDTNLQEKQGKSSVPDATFDIASVIFRSRRTGRRMRPQAHHVFAHRRYCTLHRWFARWIPACDFRLDSRQLSNGKYMPCWVCWSKLILPWSDFNVVLFWVEFDIPDMQNQAPAKRANWPQQAICGSWVVDACAEFCVRSENYTRVCCGSRLCVGRKSTWLLNLRAR